jgi:hypothetical protein
MTTTRKRGAILPYTERIVYDLVLSDLRRPCGGTSTPARSPKKLATLICDALDLLPLDPSETFAVTVTGGPADPDGPDGVVGALDAALAAIRRASDAISRPADDDPDWDNAMMRAEHVGALNAAEQIVQTVRDQWDRIDATEKEAAKG